MENKNLLDDSFASSSNGGIMLNSASKKALAETGSWSKFFAILGFIFLGLGVLMSIFSLIFSSSMGGGFSGPMSGIGGLLFNLIITAIFVMPYLYLWRFSIKIKESLNTNNQQLFSDAIVNLKSCYKYFGIATIIMLVIYPVMMIFLLAGLR